MSKHFLDKAMEEENKEFVQYCEKRKAFFNKNKENILNTKNQNEINDKVNQKINFLKNIALQMNSNNFQKCFSNKVINHIKDNHSTKNVTSDVANCLGISSEDFIIMSNYVTNINFKKSEEQINQELYILSNGLAKITFQFPDFSEFKVDGCGHTIINDKEIQIPCSKKINYFQKCIGGYKQENSYPYHSYCAGHYATQEEVKYLKRPNYDVIYKVILNKKKYDNIDLNSDFNDLIKQ